MSYGPELEPMPLRRRFGYDDDLESTRALPSGIPVEPSDRVEPVKDQFEQPKPRPSWHEQLAMAAEQSASRRDRNDEVEQPRPKPSWHEQLSRAAEDSASRMDRWIMEQRRRVAEGLDVMLEQIEERRQSEVAKLDVWKAEQRQRIEQELEREREQFRAKLMQELTAFEEQLGLRLKEQEERLARWWDEAEQMAAQRFAALGLKSRPDEGDRNT